MPNLTGILRSHTLAFGKENKEGLTMETFLTLVIAVGGIATEIGAIWAAVATRRRAHVTERSLAEQGQIFREQNERARISFEVDLMYKLQERFDSPRFHTYRKRSLTHVKENYLVDDDVLEVQHLDAATEQIFDFFEELGYLTRTGVLRLDQVWELWGSPIGLSVVGTRCQEVAR